MPAGGIGRWRAAPRGRPPVHHGCPHPRVASPGIGNTDQIRGIRHLPPTGPKLAGSRSLLAFSLSRARSGAAERGEKMRVLLFFWAAWVRALCVAGQLTWLALRRRAQLLSSSFRNQRRSSGESVLIPDAQRALYRLPPQKEKTEEEKTCARALGLTSRSLSFSQPVARWAWSQGYEINVRISVSSRLF